MKKIILVTVMFLMFAGVVSAASINGNYKGNAIIKIKSAGKELKVQDVPAIMYQDRTMVPIYLLEQLGAKVTWDEKTYSVDVQMPELNKSATEQKPSLKYLKLANKIKELGDTAREIRNFSYNLESFYNKNLFNSTNVQEDDTLYQQVLEISDYYNKSIVGEVELTAELSGIDASSIYNISNLTFTALKSFNESYENVQFWKTYLDIADKSTTQDKKTISLDLASEKKSKYLDLSVQAYKQITLAIDEADKQYKLAINKIMK